MKNFIIELQDIKKSYGKYDVLHGINMHVKPGEIYALVGRNGSGKTTIMKSICGLINIDSGNIVADDNIKYGVLIENPGLFPSMSAEENLRYLMNITGNYTKEKCDKILRLVGLYEMRNKKAKAFSLGMKQRLGIALALAVDPDILLLDEPINGLDPQGIIDIRELLLQLKNEGKTIIISSHIIEELVKIADTLATIDSGLIIEEKPLAEINLNVEQLRITTQADISEILNLMQLDFSIDTDGVTVNTSKSQAKLILNELIKRKVDFDEFYMIKETFESHFLNIRKENE